jgi:hypothetical protein
MSGWAQIEREAPEFAGRARELLAAHRHKTIATLRRDGAPRISGIEVSFRHGHLYFGGLHRSVKCLDLLRDPRFALHGASIDPPAEDPARWPGDAKVAGLAVPVDDPAEIAAALDGQAPPGPLHLFRADLHEVVITRVGTPPDHLLIESWHAGRGVRTVQRH